MPRGWIATSGRARNRLRRRYRAAAVRSAEPPKDARGPMAVQQETLNIKDSLLASLVSDENFRPVAPASIEEAGLGDEFVEQLVCKHLAVFGASKGRAIADSICLPFR